MTKRAFRPEAEKVEPRARKPRGSAKKKASAKPWVTKSPFVATRKGESIAAFTKRALVLKTDFEKWAARYAPEPELPPNTKVKFRVGKAFKTSFGAEAPRSGMSIESLSFSAVDRLEAAEQIKKGLPYSKLETFQRETGMSIEQIADATSIPRRTLARRKGERLSGEESERLVRLASMFDRARRLFEGDGGKAKAWLERANIALGGRAPIDLAGTELGGREVETLIGRLEHGVVS